MFVIVGEGTEFGRLRERAAREGLDNVRFHARIPSEDFADLLRQADIGLVNLNRRFTTPNSPSKVLDYFEAGLPVLAAIDAATDFGAMLDAAGAGLWSITGDLKAYQRNLLRLAGDPALRLSMERSGRDYLERNLTVERAYETIVANCRAPAPSPGTTEPAGGPSYDVVSQVP